MPAGDAAVIGQEAPHSYRQNRQGSHWRRLRHMLMAALASFVAAAGDARAQGIEVTHIATPPTDCMSLLDPAKRGGMSLDWRDSVAVEHCDRLKRLWNLTASTREGSVPIFYDVTIGKDHMPPEVGVDVPVLRVVFPERVFFDTASATLLPDALHVIEIVAKNLKRDVPDVSVFVTGHTDSRGGWAYNHDLSERRAGAVARALLIDIRGGSFPTERGSRTGHIWRVGFGKDFPIAPNDSPEHMALNRRVEFLLGGRVEAVLYYLSQLEDLICSGVSAADREHCLKVEDIQANKQGYTAVEINMPSAPTPSIDHPTATLAAPAITLTPAPVRQVIITPYLRHVDPITPILNKQPTGSD